MAALIRNGESRIAKCCYPLLRTTYSVYRIQRRNCTDSATSSKEEVNADKDKTEGEKQEKKTPWMVGSVFPTEISLSPVVQATKDSETKQFVTRKHPGNMSIKTVQIPEVLERAVNIVLEGKKETTILAKAKKLKNFLSHRIIPLDDKDFTLRAKKIEDQVLTKKPEMTTRLQELESKENLTKAETEEFSQLTSQIKSIVMVNLRASVYHTLSPEYNSDVCLQYMVARIAENYSVMIKCLSEIKKRDPEYHPCSVFDMGSGLGTTVWAVHALWKEGYKELYCVDSAIEMVKLSSLLLRGANPQREMIYPNVYIRSNMPSPNTNRYSMVVCAHTLFDVREKVERTRLIKDLWKMTTNYIILVDNGTYNGHVLIQEARAAILKQAKKDKEEAHVFAPCPHDRTCPIFELKQYKVGCKSQVKFRPLQMNGGEHQHEKFSYVIIKKGPLIDESSSWPRLIKPTNRRNKHLHCYACCPDGKLNHYVFTKQKHNDLYSVAKFSDWGDLLPVEWPYHSSRWDYHYTENIKTDDIKSDDSKTDVICETSESEVDFELSDEKVLHERDDSDVD